MEKIICVAGPTASGKTRLAVELAKAYDGEVLSCDSMQIYRGMAIGTAAPTPEEMQGVVHHMIGVADPGEDFSVGKYVELAEPVLQDILSRGKTCVVCGGTGLYADSLLLGRSFAPCPSTGMRETLEAEARQSGIEPLLARLKEVDPEAGARLHPSDKRRIIRALEVYLETGETISEHNRKTKLLPPKHEAVWIGLSFENRQDLYDRIDLRVEVGEVPQEALRQGPGGETSAQVRARGTEARERQQKRYEGTGLYANAQIGARQLSRFCALDGEGEKLLAMAAERWGLSMRGRARVMKIARTIADLEGGGAIEARHVAEALQFRMGGIGRP